MKMWAGVNLLPFVYCRGSRWRPKYYSTHDASLSREKIEKNKKNF